MIEEFPKFKDYSAKINFEEKNSEYTWNDLFKGLNLLNGYKYFLQIDILSMYKKNFKEWDGYTESRLRKLVISFIDINQIKLRPFSVWYNIEDPKYKFSKTYFYGINFVDPATIEPQPNKIINLRDPVKKFVIESDKNRKTKKETEEIKEINDINVRINFICAKDLPLQVLYGTNKT